MNEVWPMLQAISQTDTVPVVRVPWNDPATIMKALDLGAYGIIVPLVNTAADAAKAIGVPLSAGDALVGAVRALHYGGADYVAHANDEIVIMAMIETKEGLANLDAICATPGLDAVYIQAIRPVVRLGHGPCGDNRTVHLATCDTIREAAHKHGIKAVMHVRAPRFAAGQSEARLRHGHADVGSDVDDRWYPTPARRAQGRHLLRPQTRRTP